MSGSNQGFVGGFVALIVVLFGIAVFADEGGGLGCGSPPPAPMILEEASP